MANGQAAVKIPQELGIGIFECSGVDRGKIEENKSGTRKIVGEETVTAACCAALFKSVRATFDRAPASIVYPIPTGRTDVILLFGKGRLGGREWECGFAKIGTRTCLDFMTALLEFKRYERRIYSVIHWRNLYSINELRWIFMQILYYDMFRRYFTQMARAQNVSVVSIHKIRLIRSMWLNQNQTVKWRSNFLQLQTTF